MSTSTDVKKGKISVIDITEEQLKMLVKLAKEEAVKPKLPQKFIDILEINYPLYRDVVDNRGYKSLQAILLKSLNIDVSMNTLRQYMSLLSKKYSGATEENKKKKRKKNNKVITESSQELIPVELEEASIKETEKSNKTEESLDEESLDIEEVLNTFGISKDDLLDILENE